uniref:Uncharacterized protein n=1 Tax=Anser cygnoides TaxID=8845 RepID=A0A8B9EBH2_ANSCY
ALKGINPSPGNSAVTVPETLLFISTLDGNLHAVSKSTGDIKWTLKDDPILQVPVYVAEPAFLPDPNDGSLYILGGKNKEGLMVSSAAGGCLHPTRPSLLSRGWAGQARGVRWLLLALVTLVVSA